MRVRFPPGVFYQVPPELPGESFYWLTLGFARFNDTGVLFRDAGERAERRDLPLFFFCRATDFATSGEIFKSGCQSRDLRRLARRQTRFRFAGRGAETPDFEAVRRGFLRENLRRVERRQPGDGRRDTRKGLEKWTKRLRKRFANAPNKKSSSKSIAADVRNFRKAKRDDDPLEARRTRRSKAVRSRRTAWRNDSSPGDERDSRRNEIERSRDESD